MTSEASTNEPTIIIDDADMAEVPIPANLKFMLDAMKLLSQNPLTTENLLIWSSQVTTIFQANGFSKHLNPQTPIPNKTITSATGQITNNPLFLSWNLINSNLIAALIATISPSLQPLVLRKNTVADVWTSLMSHLQSQSRSRIIQLKEELHSLTMKSDSMSQYLNNIKSIHDQLEAADSHIEEEDLIIYIMNGLPGPYNSFKTDFRLKSERVDVNTFYSLLLTEEMNISRQHKTELQQQSMALAASRGRGSSTRPPPLPEAVADPTPAAQTTTIPPPPLPTVEDGVAPTINGQPPRRLPASNVKYATRSAFKEIELFTKAHEFIKKLNRTN